MAWRFPHRFYFSKWYWYWLGWQQFWRFFHGYHQLDDLDHLIEWAKRKRFKGVQAAYLRRWDNLDLSLFRDKLRYPHLARGSYVCYQLMTLLFSSSHSYQYGSNRT